jgi:hypothetical protein
MGLKWFTRMGEWVVKIYQGILGMGNLGFPGKPKRANNRAICDMFKVPVPFSDRIFYRHIQVTKVYITLSESAARCGR